MSRNDIDSLRRDLRLALEQRDQADRLVNTLTERCDSLRKTLIGEREDFQKQISSLNHTLSEERNARTQAEAELREVSSRLKEMEVALASERKRSNALKALAEAAVAEASRAINEYTED